MREMNQSDNKSEARLRESLRSMAAATRRNAPAEIGDTLAIAFRRHHARRRLVRRVSLLATVFVTGLLSALLLSRKNGAEAPVRPVVENANSLPSISVPDLPTRPVQTVLPPRKSRPHQKPAIAHEDHFVALPSYDQHAQARDEDLRIVRLQLSGLALRSVGAPVSGDLDDRRVLADFVVGQDGTPYAVRLLRQNLR